MSTEDRLCAFVGWGMYALGGFISMLVHPAGVLAAGAAMAAWHWFRRESV